MRRPLLSLLVLEHPESTTLTPLLSLAAASLPGDTHVTGLWPAAWMMSNLGTSISSSAVSPSRPLAHAGPPRAGRAGYGGSLDGTWPYVYDTCDVGTLANQTDPATGLPEFDPSEGDQYHDDDLSWLSGQRFSRCTCPEETDHPGPQYANGTWKGRCVGVVLFFAEVRASARC